jgi:MarR family transcriptional regulator, organic hydroperoxide resistance regulator
VRIVRVMSDETYALPTYHKALLQTIAYKHVREAVNLRLKDFQLNATQWMMLGILYEQTSAQKISSIAKTLQVEVPLITTLAQPLLAVGHIAQHEDKNDRRSKPVTLTEAGRAMVERIEQQLADDLHMLEAGISQAEIKQYFTTLRTVIANGDKLEVGRKA